MSTTIRESIYKARRARVEEECQDKACSDAKNVFKSFMKNGETNPECPLDREKLGRFTWSLLHTIGAKYPTNPSKEQKNEMREFIRILSNIYPCSYCAEEFRTDISEMPPQLESRNSFALWLCQVHNRTNERLNKPKFDCSKVDERWRTGWKDGSCN